MSSEQTNQSCNVQPTSAHNSSRSFSRAFRWQVDTQSKSETHNCKYCHIFYRNFSKIYKYHISIYGLNQTSELPSFVCGTAKLEPVQVSNLPNSSNLSFEIRLFFGTSQWMKTWKMQLVIIKLLHCQPHEGSCRISKSSEPRGLQLLDVKTSPASD